MDAMEGISNRMAALEGQMADLKELILNGPPGIKTGDSSAKVVQQSSAPMWVCVVIVAVAITWAAGKDGGKAEAIIQQQAQMAVMQRKIDRVEDYQTTSYMLLPELRKQIEESLNKRKPQEK